MESVKEAISRRAFEGGVERIAARVKAGEMGLRDGHFAMLVLFDTVFPFMDPIQKPVLNDAMTAWNRLLAQSERELATGDRLVETLGTEEAW